MAGAPLTPREYATAVWTGQEALVFGGDTSPCPPTARCVAPEDPPPVDAAAYDPASDRWRQVADLPAGMRSPQAAAAGGEVYVLSPAAPGQPGRFLRYIPARDEWQEFPPPPGEPSQLTAEGDVLAAYHPSHERGISPDAVFDPEVGAWRELPRSPLGAGFDRRLVALNDNRLALIDLELVDNPGSVRPSLYRAAVLDLRDGSWRRLPDSAVVGSDPSWLAVDGMLVNATDGAYDGGETNNWGRSYPAGGILDPASGRWLPLPPRPQGEAGSFGTGGGFPDVAGGGVVIDGRWVLRPADQSWSRLPDLPALDNMQGVASVWAGDRLFVWGDARFTGNTPRQGQLLGDGWTWRPEQVRTTETSPASKPPPSPTPDAAQGRSRWADPLRLVGSWQLDADGEEPGAVLRLDGGGVLLWRGCGALTGSWRANREEMFVADLYGGYGNCRIEPPITPPWLATVAAYRADRDGAMLLDAVGAVVARLRPGGRPTAPPGTDPSLADPPEVTPTTRQAFPRAAALPAGLMPTTASTLIGRWIPADDDIRRPDQPTLELRADGTYRGSDGCNGSNGRWTAGTGGAVLATSGVQTLIGCHNLNVTAWLSAAARAGFDGDFLVLLAPDGTETGRLRRG